MFIFEIKLKFILIFIKQLLFFFIRDSRLEYSQISIDLIQCLVFRIFLDLKRYKYIWSFFYSIFYIYCFYNIFKYIIIIPNIPLFPFIFYFFYLRFVHAQVLNSVPFSDFPGQKRSLEAISTACAQPFSLTFYLTIRTWSPPSTFNVHILKSFSIQCPPTAFNLFP